MCIAYECYVISLKTTTAIIDENGWLTHVLLFYDIHDISDHSEVHGVQGRIQTSATDANASVRF